MSGKEYHVSERGPAIQRCKCYKESSIVAFTVIRMIMNARTYGVLLLVHKWL